MRISLWMDSEGNGELEEAEGRYSVNAPTVTVVTAENVTVTLSP